MIKACDRFRNHRNQDLTVQRVAKDGTWADVFIYDNRTHTSERGRVALPLAPEWVAK